MNTKELLNLARFCHVTIEDNLIVSIEREGDKDEGFYRLHTADGVVYDIPDQVPMLNIINDEIYPIDVIAIMPGRLPEDSEVKIGIVLQKLQPITVKDIGFFTIAAHNEELSAEQDRRRQNLRGAFQKVFGHAP